MSRPVPQVQILPAGDSSLRKDPDGGRREGRGSEHVMGDTPFKLGSGDLMGDEGGGEGVGRRGELGLSTSLL